MTSSPFEFFLLISIFSCNSYIFFVSIGSWKCFAYEPLKQTLHEWGKCFKISMTILPILLSEHQKKIFIYKNSGKKIQLAYKGEKKLGEHSF